MLKFIFHLNYLNWSYLDNNTLVDVLGFLKLILGDSRILSYYSEQEFGNW